MQSGAAQESNSVIVRLFRLLLNNNGQNRREAMCNKTKNKLRDQLPKCDFKEALLMDMKSKPRSI